ncbi:MAG: hypothetical protein IT208_15550 [Chthonomonadales bacterium]|nr:hypothetical protein [Chthonomonadales bacterium]
MPEWEERESGVALRLPGTYREAGVEGAPGRRGLGRGAGGGRLAARAAPAPPDDERWLADALAGQGFDALDTVPLEPTDEGVPRGARADAAASSPT